MVNIACGATALVTGAARLPAHLPPPPPLVPNDGVATGEDDVVVAKRGCALLTDFGADDCLFKHPFAAAFMHGNSTLRKWREAGDLTVPPAEVEDEW